jgi:hypothetical protein
VRLIQETKTVEKFDPRTNLFLCKYVGHLVFLSQKLLAPKKQTQSASQKKKNTHTIFCKEKEEDCIRFN